MFPFRLALVILLFTASSCIKERFDPGAFDASLSLEPGLAVPVGYSTLRVEKYLRDASEDSIQIIASDGFLTLRYSRNVFSAAMDGLLSLPPVNVNTSLPNLTGADIFLPPGSDTLEFSDTVSIPFGLAETTARIDSIRLLSGTIETAISAPGLNVTISYEFPGFLLDGSPLILPPDLSGSGFNQSLEGYTLVARHETGTPNLLDCYISISITGTSTVIPQNSDILALQVNLANLNFETLYGDFTGFNIPIPSFQYDPGVFNTIVSGSFELAAPKIGLYFQNSVGAAGGIAFSQLETLDRNGVRRSLSGTGVPVPSNPRIIRYPGAEEEGQIIEDSIIIDQNTSNLPEILGSNPVSIFITAGASLAPPEDGTSAFLRHDSRYVVDALLEIPVWGKADFLIMLDTLSFDYLSTGLPVPEEIERLIVRIILKNGFPVEVKPQVYFLDENYALLDSLFNGNEAIEGGKDVNGDGKVDPETQDPFDIDLTREKIESLSETHFIVTRGGISTTGFSEDRDVKFYAGYALEYNFGLIAQLKIAAGK